MAQRRIQNGNNGRKANGVYTERDALRGAASRYRKKRFGTSGIAVILCTVLFVSVVAASVYHIASLERPQKNRQDDLAESILSENTEEQAKEAFEYISVSKDDVNSGELILVNYENEYVPTDDVDELVNIYENKSENYGVAYNYYMLDGDVLSVFDELTAELKVITGDSSVLVNSAYRSVEDQQKLYDDYLALYGEDYVKTYVATPGYSEHHTGLAFDLTVRYPDGTYVKMENYEHYAEFNTLAIKYGFVRRFPENKYSYTRIGNEPWHYRYVGIPHAYVIGKKNLCLEEYITLVQTYTTDGELLYVDGKGEIGTIERGKLDTVEAGYVIYHVSADDAAKLPVPLNADSYTVSGDNCGGFIVTAVFGECELPEIEYVAYNAAA